MNDDQSCCCAELSDLAIIGMGDTKGLDERVFATLELALDHGEEKWWLYVSRCSACEQHWMVAQEERIHDNYCFKRINSQTFQEISQGASWPSDFLLYEQVLMLGREAGFIATFIDPKSPALVETIADLKSARSDITLEEISHVLAIPTKQVQELLRD